MLRKRGYTLLWIYCTVGCTGTGVPGTVHTYIHTFIHEGKDEAMASGRVIFQSVAGTGSRSYILK